MRKLILSVSSLAVASLWSGCVGVGPNTQQGAVTGGTLGAIAGAVIGHNSRGGDTLGGAILGGTAGAIAGGTLGNSVDNQRGTLYDDGYGYRRVPAYQTQAAPPPPPPAPAETVTAAPAANAVWVPGYWVYDGRAYAWVGGHWEIPPQNAHTYVASHWENQGRGYVYVQSYWR
ncbi:MAG TPA: YXWGXW repeat-containing protein [Opitutaceae bacterium]|nr:YXWGXW repeat-containing protein [Opitutaceae bacterium]